MRYKVVMGVAREDPDNFPELKLFETVLNETVENKYEVLQNTFRIVPVQGNVLFCVMVKEIDISKFVGDMK